MSDIAEGIGIFFWFFILLVFLWPQIQHKMLQDARLRLIRKIERKENARVISMIHRQERISLFGIPLYRYIDIEDSEQVLRAIRNTPPDMPICLIIHTPGGLVLAAAQIALALKDHPAKKKVIVPHYAMSGGTLIALAADEIVMDPHAVLGPVDPQLADSTRGSLPAVSIIRAVQQKGVDKVDDETLIKADIAAKAVKQMEELIVRLTRDKLGEEKARKLAEALAGGQWTHDYPITVEQLRELGLPVTVGIPPEVYTLMELYPQPIQARPTVEFVPTPHYPTPGRRTERS
ncbi:hypothetical protein DRO53_02675 [Candidatus Bathyarchaeota archaeon]|nr:MAG: hypothetical protein DRO46_00330 [Candidatus Hecatellales archaeon]RLI34839.1 MAG: hypothetical protein DRO53_02675 [Candidatus Bathyarchaeota archaeon]